LDVCSRSFKVKTENHEQVYQVHTDSVYTFLTLNLIIFSLNHPLRLTLCSSILHIVCKLMTLSETYQNKRQARMYLYDFKINFSVSVSDERPRRCSQDQGWIIVRYRPYMYIEYADSLALQPGTCDMLVGAFQ